MKETDENKGQGSGCSDANCYANIWIHSHFETGEPVQIDASHWNGDTFLLDVFYNESVGDIMHTLKTLPTESDIEVKIEFDYETGVTGESLDRQYYVKLITLA